MITVQCPRCGGTAQLESGKSAMCPYCALELTAPQTPDAVSFGQDVQYAPPPVQTAPEPVSLEKPAEPSVETQQDAGAFVRQTQVQQNAGVFVRQSMTDAPFGVFAEDEDEHFGEKKRRSWRWMNAGILALQTFLCGAGIFANETGRDSFSNAMILGWMLSLLVCPIVSAATRPDNCYFTKSPIPKHKFLLYLVMLLLGMAAIVPGAIIETWLEPFLR
ncbi:MAG TPA: hypothetical protein DDX71_03990 [Ruminococcus sp.]|nr:hypothetical protein [Ruminococcus sp.]